MKPRPKTDSSHSAFLKPFGGGNGDRNIVGVSLNSPTLKRDPTPFPEPASGPQLFSVRVPSPSTERSFLSLGALLYLCLFSKQAST